MPLVCNGHAVAMQRAPRQDAIRPLRQGAEYVKIFRRDVFGWLSTGYENRRKITIFDPRTGFFRIVHVLRDVCKDCSEFLTLRTALSESTPYTHLYRNLYTHK